MHTLRLRVFWLWLVMCLCILVYLCISMQLYTALMLGELSGSAEYLKKSPYGNQCCVFSTATLCTKFLVDSTVPVAAQIDWSRSCLLLTLQTLAIPVALLSVTCLHFCLDSPVLIFAWTLTILLPVTCLDLCLYTNYCIARYLPWPQLSLSPSIISHNGLHRDVVLF